jgi:ATP-dependent helicase/nuclease subunit A
VRIPAAAAGTWRASAAGGVAERDLDRDLDPAVHPERSAGGTESKGPALGTPLLAPAPPASPVRLSVTDLAEHARCPRRVFLARHLGLAEAGSGGAPARDDPDRATARGTLAHAMLAEIDLGAPPLERRVQLDGVARRRGYDPRARGVRLILGDVTRFLDSAAGRALASAARAGTLRREVPFLLRLGDSVGPRCYLAGAVDAVLEAPREIAVVDFKYAAPRPAAVARYRVQLLAYVLAAARAYPGRKVTARLQFLRGTCAAIDLTPTQAELRRFAREAPGLAAAAHAGEALRATPEALGRTVERCAADGCGFVARCFAPPRRTAQAQRR